MYIIIKFTYSIYFLFLISQLSSNICSVGNEERDNIKIPGLLGVVPDGIVPLGR